ncbi:MAG: hypothetical protein LQ342_002585 [Letrouitia transgressa]|nr:MAG: hypothetical protein LQ342_002585 [Letrouitia transgressa]
MELARAFTKRSKRSDLTINSPTRGTSIRKHNGAVDHSVISPPIELLSTTNVQALNAPDLHSALRNSPLSSSASSIGDSDMSLAFSPSSRDTTPETSSIESAPSPVEPNHLTGYFQSVNKPSLGSPALQSDVDVPAVPSRAKSHTKLSHQASARKRSNSRNIPPPNVIHTEVAPACSSIDIFNGNPEADHPFGAELAQVNELAEEIGASEARTLDEEEQYLVENGLCKFTVDDYIDEIQSFFQGMGFSNSFSASSSIWI